MQCGLLGRKLGHSYSPQIHRELGSYGYCLYEKEPWELEAFLKSGTFAGLNVTIPYKKDVIPYLDELSPVAKRLGAVNTIVRKPDGSLMGHNTDYFGFRYLVRRSGLEVKGKKVLVLGSGGASNTAVAVLEELGAQVVIISRSGENNYGNLQLHADASVIVNTTPVGMFPNTGVSPVDLGVFPKLDGVLDAIYNPARTKLLLDGERRGLMVALELEEYSYTPGDKALSRATEQTVPERLPPRVAIRRGAALEMPHVMVLIDDREDRLMRAMEESTHGQAPLYDFELMQGGGHLTGYAVQQTAQWQEIAEILEGLKEKSGDGFLFAVGDGNHSLAAAKAYWEEKKQTLPLSQQQDDPARFALVEVVNLYDPAMPFLPIHRLLYHVDPEEVQRQVGFDAGNPPSLQELQPRLDRWLDDHPQAELEYIHGEKECRALAGEAPDRLAILYDTFDRGSVFPTVQKNGVFVRKSFSLGEACEKRYYLECRRIR